MNPAFVSQSNIITRRSKNKPLSTYLASSEFTGQPKLLTAKFEINGKIYSVVVDTGATISCIPEKGKIAKESGLVMKQANLNLKLANDQIVHVGKSVDVHIRPINSSVAPKPITCYVHENAYEILGNEALIGLNILSLFDIGINAKNGKFSIYHESKCIGTENNTFGEYKATVSLDDRFDSYHSDTDLLRLLKRYKSVFADINAEPIKGKPMRFITLHQKPIFAKTRNYSQKEATEIKEHVLKLLEQGIIEPSSSGYAATSRMVPKKSGQGRLVVNYIPLNRVTVRDSYCLPNIQDIINTLKGNNYFSTMDCNQGFYQILVDWRDRHKTAFSTPIGNYQFIRCPFGARNSPAFFQATMNRIFMEGLFKRCIVYVDDILVFGKSRQEHDENLEWVLEKCKAFNVKLKLSKCKFAQREVEFLGFLIDGTHIKPKGDRLETLKNLQPPRDKTELKSMIGQLLFYARFIPNFSENISPLRNLLLKNSDFQWKLHHQVAFDKLIQSLEMAQNQRLPDKDSFKVLELAVTNNSYEASLLNENNELLHRAGRLMSPTQQNYSIVEQYLTALVFALKRFGTVLNPSRLKVRCPVNLEKVFKLINKPERVERLLLQLPEGFDTFEFEEKGVVAKQQKSRAKNIVPLETYYTDGAAKNNGKKNCIASWAVCAENDKELELTGLVEKNPSNNAAELTAAIKACEYAKAIGQNEIQIVTDSKYLHSAATLWIDKWKNNGWLDYKNKRLDNEQLFKHLLDAKEGLNIDWVWVDRNGDNLGNIRADALAKARLANAAQIISAVHFDEQVFEDDEYMSQLRLKINKGLHPDFTIVNDTIYYLDPKKTPGHNKRIVVPEQMRKTLLKMAHDSPEFGGHLGIRKTCIKLSRYWWPRMAQYIEKYVKSCDTCQRMKSPKGPPVGELHPIPVSKVFEHIHIDLIGPMKATCHGNKYIITATDAFSKWAFAKAVGHSTADVIIKFVESMILTKVGKPSVIISDRGSQFISHEWKEFLKRKGIKHHLTTAYHPQANGIDERVNGTIIRILRNYVNNDCMDWDTHLDQAVFLYNSTPHDSTGFTPFNIVYGSSHRSPLTFSESDGLSLETIDRIREDIRKAANSNNKAAQHKQKRNYDKHHSICDLSIGEFVLYKDHVKALDGSKKLRDNWLGPAKIVRFIDGNKALTIYDFALERERNVAVPHVKRYINRGDEEDIINITTDGYSVDPLLTNHAPDLNDNYVQQVNNQLPDITVIPSDDNADKSYADPLIDLTSDPCVPNTNADIEEPLIEFDIVNNIGTNDQQNSTSIFSPKHVVFNDEANEIAFYPRDPNWNPSIQTIDNSRDLIDKSLLIPLQSTVRAPEIREEQGSSQSYATEPSGIATTDTNTEIRRANFQNEIMSDATQREKVRPNYLPTWGIQKDDSSDPTFDPQHHDDSSNDSNLSTSIRPRTTSTINSSVRRRLFQIEKPHTRSQGPVPEVERYSANSRQSRPKLRAVRRLATPHQRTPTTSNAQTSRADTPNIALDSTNDDTIYTTDPNSPRELANDSSSSNDLEKTLTNPNDNDKRPIEDTNTSVDADTSYETDQLTMIEKTSEGPPEISPTPARPTYKSQHSYNTRLSAKIKSVEGQALSSEDK